MCQGQSRHEGRRFAPLLSPAVASASRAHASIAHARMVMGMPPSGRERREPGGPRARRRALRREDRAQPRHNRGAANAALQGVDVATKEGVEAETTGAPLMTETAEPAARLTLAPTFSASRKSLALPFIWPTS